MKIIYFWSGLNGVFDRLTIICFCIPKSFWKNSIIFNVNIVCPDVRFHSIYPCVLIQTELLTLFYNLKFHWIISAALSLPSASNSSWRVNSWKCIERRHGGRTLFAVLVLYMQQDASNYPAPWEAVYVDVTRLQASPSERFSSPSCRVWTRDRLLFYSRSGCLCICLATQIICSSELVSEAVSHRLGGPGPLWQRNTLSIIR